MQKNANTTVKSVAASLLASVKTRLTLMAVCVLLCIATTFAWYSTSFQVLSLKLSVGYMAMNLEVYSDEGVALINDANAVASNDVGENTTLVYNEINLGLVSEPDADFSSVYFKITNNGQIDISAYLKFLFKTEGGALSEEMYSQISKYYKYRLVDVTSEMNAYLAGAASGRTVASYIAIDKNSVTAAQIAGDLTSKAMPSLSVDYSNKFGIIDSASSGTASNNVGYYRFDICVNNIPDSVRSVLKDVEFDAYVMGRQANDAGDGSTRQVSRVGTEQQFLSALNTSLGDDEIILTSDITVNRDIMFNYGVSLTFAGKKLTVDGDFGYSYLESNKTVMSLTSGSSLRITGDFTVNAPNADFVINGSGGDQILLGHVISGVRQGGGFSIDARLDRTQYYYDEVYERAVYDENALIGIEQAKQSGMQINGVGIRAYQGDGLIMPANLSIAGETALTIGRNTTVGTINSTTSASYLYLFNAGTIRNINFSTMATAALGNPVTNYREGQTFEQIYIENSGVIGGDITATERVILLPNFASSEQPLASGVSHKIQNNNTYIYYRIGSNADKDNPETSIARGSVTQAVGSGTTSGAIVEPPAEQGLFNYTNVVYESIPDAIEYLGNTTALYGKKYQNAYRLNIVEALTPTAENPNPTLYKLLADYYWSNCNDSAFTHLRASGIYDEVTFAASINYLEIATYNGQVLTVSLQQDPVFTLSNCEYYNLTAATFDEDAMEGTFYGNSALRYIELPSGLKRIGADTFADTRLSFITLPESIEIVEEGAFVNIDNNGYGGDIFVTINVGDSGLSNSILQGFDVNKTFVFAEASAVEGLRDLIDRQNEYESQHGSISGFENPFMGNSEWYYRIYQLASVVTDLDAVINESESLYFAASENDSDKLASIVLFWGIDFSKSQSDNLLSIIPSAVKLNDESYAVSSVGDYAFYHVKNVSELDPIDYVAASPSLERIGVKAFFGLYINKVVLGNLSAVGVECFSKATIAHLDLGKVAQIGESCFEDANIMYATRTYNGGAVNAAMTLLGENAFAGAILSSGDNTVSAGVLDLSGAYAPSANSLSMNISYATLKLNNLTLLAAEATNGLTLIDTNLLLNGAIELGASVFSIDNNVSMNKRIYGYDVDISDVMRYGANCFYATSGIEINTLTAGIAAEKCDAENSGYAVDANGIFPFSAGFTINTLRLSGVFKDGPLDGAGVATSTILRSRGIMVVNSLVITSDCARIAGSLFNDVTTSGVATLTINNVQLSGTSEQLNDYALNIGAYAFASDRTNSVTFTAEASAKMANVIFPKTEAIGSNAFIKAVFNGTPQNITFGQTTLAESAFAQSAFASASKLIFNQTTVGDSAFKSATFANLTEISINGCTVGSEMFNMSQFANPVTINNTQTAIGERQFYGGDATNVGAVHQPTNLNVVNLVDTDEIGAWAFRNCEIATLRLNEVTSIGDYAFYGAHVTTSAARSVTSAVGTGAGATTTTEYVGGKMSYLGQYAFGNFTLGGITSTNSGVLDLSGNYNNYFNNGASAAGYTPANNALRNMTIYSGTLRLCGLASVTAAQTTGLSMENSNLYLDGTRSVGAGAFSKTSNSVSLNGSTYDVSIKDVLIYGSGIFNSSSVLSMSSLHAGIEASYLAANSSTYSMAQNGLLYTGNSVSIINLYLDGDFADGRAANNPILRSTGGALAVSNLIITERVTNIADATFAMVNNRTMTVSNVISASAQNGVTIGDNAFNSTANNYTVFSETATLALGVFFQKVVSVGAGAFRYANFTKISNDVVCEWRFADGVSLGDYSFAYTVNPVTSSLMAGGNGATIGSFAFYRTQMSNLKAMNFVGANSIGESAFNSLVVAACSLTAYDVPYINEGAFEFGSGSSLSTAVFGISSERLTQLGINLENCYYGYSNPTTASKTVNGTTYLVGGIFSTARDALNTSGLTGGFSVETLELRYSMPGGLYSYTYGGNFRSVFAPAISGRTHTFNTLIIGFDCEQITAAAFHSNVGTAVRIGSLINNSTGCAIRTNAFRESEWDENTSLNLNNCSIGDYAFINAVNIVELTVSNSGAINGSGTFNISTLNTVTFGEGVSSIDYRVFNGTTSVRRINILRTDALIGLTARLITGTNRYVDANATLWVPAALYNGYRANNSYWRYFDIEYNFNVYNTATESWYYMLLAEDSNEVAIASYQRLASATATTTLNVPSTLGDYTVTRILDGAFTNSTINNITVINIPSTVKSIDSQAITARSITSVTVDSANEYLTVQGSVANGNMTLFSKDMTILYFYFTQNVSADRYVVPTNVKLIMPYAFESTTAIKTFVLTGYKVVTVLDEYTFGTLYTISLDTETSVYVEKLSDIRIVVPSDMYRAYNKSSYYTKIMIAVTADESLNALSDGDYLYTLNGDSATIIGYCGGGGIINIPATLGGATVTAIGDYAFAGNEYITQVNLSANIVSIAATAFLHCVSLASVPTV